LEIALLGGDRERPAFTGYPGSVSWIGSEVSPADLRTRIAARAADQFAGGLIDEAEALRTRFGPDVRAFSAFGYAEAFDVLDGRRTVSDAVDVDATRTWAFAQRQRTWFRSEADVEWIPTGSGDPDPPEAALRIARRLAEHRDDAGAPSVAGR
jgi:tRNA A37 N6-isopentenylltransferase MiaA